MSIIAAVASAIALSLVATSIPLDHHAYYWLRNNRVNLYIQHVLSSNVYICMRHKGFVSLQLLNCPCVINLPLLGKQTCLGFHYAYRVIR